MGSHSHSLLPLFGRFFSHLSLSLARPMIRLDSLRSKLYSSETLSPSSGTNIPRRFGAEASLATHSACQTSVQSSSSNLAGDTTRWPSESQVSWLDARKEGKIRPLSPHGVVDLSLWTLMQSCILKRRARCSRIALTDTFWISVCVTGDSTLHLIHRLQQGELSGMTPKLVVLNIGTNDLHTYWTREEITVGVDDGSRKARTRAV
jgi:hypothetical protein